MLPFLLTLRRVVRGIWRGLRDPEFQVLFSLAFLTVLSGTLFYAQFEAMRWLDALYFSVITLTTIGYGDFAPQTDIGKIFTIGYVLTGVGIMVGFITRVFDHLQKARIDEIEAKQKTPPSDP
ncbi:MULTISPECIES: potassium channel family protein [unclassified Exiguobacterium]|uniref:potassium channel family protein n=1 Tax=unclassified Exiguobacterium TaxID=2644629 RepID=UPI001BE9F2A3|nr:MULTISPECIES: potassium channel family protein [unclassified Exiguobacterium]